MKRVFIIVGVLLIGIVGFYFVYLNTSDIADVQLQDKDERCSIQQPKEDICDGIFLGAEFNRKTSLCEDVSWGCEYPPFEDLQSCQSVCE